MNVSRRILLHVMLSVVFVLAVVTAVTYAMVFAAIKQRDLDHLQTYVNERAAREESRFLGVQTNLTLVRARFLKRMDEPMTPAQVGERFNHWYRRYDDGAWRSREQFKDARRYSSMWADKEWPCTLEQQRLTVIAQELCDEMLPGWVDVFPSYYFQFTEPGLVNVGVDIRLADWAWYMPAHFDITGLEWVAAALPKERPPPDRFTWTGVQQDDAVPDPCVCVYLPVVKDGAFIASAGHNLSMGRLFDASKSDIPGARHYIFRTDGRLIAHPEKAAGILASRGLLTADDCGDPVVASLYHIALDSTQRRFSGYDPERKTYYSMARLAGPEWYYVTAMSRDYLQKQAFLSAQWVLWSGLVSLVLVLIATTAIVQRVIARPLAELTHATRELSAGGTGAAVPVSRADELGELARAFATMVEKVSARENDLRHLNADLERRVADRTEELHAALAHERELGEMKSRFVSLVSHEFRTPLGVIMSASDVLLRYIERLPKEKRERHLDMIVRSTRNLAQLVDEALLLGRVEEGRMQFTPTPLDLEKLCRTLSDELRSATNAACPIRFTALTPLGGAVSDESLLRHILSNLLSNAVKYSEPGSEVMFTAGREGDSVIFTVRDRGIGIPEEDQARLFESFSRGSNVGQRPGTGLGLVVVQRCVQLHGGSIKLESKRGAGTTVTVSLPVFGAPPTSSQTPT